MPCCKDTRMNATKRSSLLALCCVVTLWIAFAVVYETRAEQKMDKLFRIYEKILSACFYDLDVDNAQRHMDWVFALNAAVRAISIRHVNGELFAQGASPFTLGFVDELLVGSGLTQKKNAKYEVVQGDRVIGEILFVYIDDSMYTPLSIGLLAVALGLVAYGCLVLALERRRRPAGASSPDVALSKGSLLGQEIQAACEVIKKSNKLLRDSRLSPTQEECARRLRCATERLAALALLAVEREEQGGRNAPTQEKGAASVKTAPRDAASSASAAVPPDQNVEEENARGAWSPEKVLARLGIDPDDLPQYARISLEEMERRVASCRAALESDDLPSANLHAHTLKSTSGSMALGECRALAQDLESAAANADQEQAKILLARFERALRQERGQIEHAVALLESKKEESNAAVKR